MTESFLVTYTLLNEYNKLIEKYSNKLLMFSCRCGVAQRFDGFPVITKKCLIFKRKEAVYIMNILIKKIKEITSQIELLEDITGTIKVKCKNPTERCGYM